MSLKFVPKVRINYDAALIQIMSLVPSHYLNRWWLVYWCVIRHQWVHISGTESRIIRDSKVGSTPWLLMLCIHALPSRHEMDCMGYTGHWRPSRMISCTCAISKNNGSFKKYFYMSWKQVSTGLTRVNYCPRSRWQLDLRFRKKRSLIGQPAHDGKDLSMVK